MGFMTAWLWRRNSPWKCYLAPPPSQSAKVTAKRLRLSSSSSADRQPQTGYTYAHFNCPFRVFDPRRPANCGKIHSCIFMSRKFFLPLREHTHCGYITYIETTLYARRRCRSVSLLSLSPFYTATIAAAFLFGHERT